VNEIYQSHGVQFEYPEDWELTETRDDTEIMITVQSPDTSFWLLTLVEDRPDPERLAEAALAAFREEYDDLDVYPVEETGDASAIGAWDLEFRCLEVYNSAWIRTFQTDFFSALILYQSSDKELDETRGILQGMTASLCSVETE
jgi:hypothetical protein